jgi:hypothetical protein
MAARKSIAKSARGKRSGRASSRASALTASGEGARDKQRAGLLEDLSMQLALVETASIALQKFEDQQEIGAICASLEHAVSMLMDAHERVRHCLEHERSRTTGCPTHRREHHSGDEWHQ